MSSSVSNFTKNIHKGLVVKVDSPTSIWVWIPTYNSGVPLGQFDYLGENTGGVLHGKNLIDADGTAVLCKICTPITSGSWFRWDEGRGASVFTNKKNLESEDYVDYRINPSYMQRYGNGMGNLSYNSDTPALTLCPCSPTLNVSGGTPIPNTGNVPPGVFPRLQPNQHVLVAFINSSTTPIILGTLPTDEELSAMLG